MLDYNNYIYDENCVFGKQALKDRLEKQLGDFGEQLVMTLLGRIEGYSVALVDHEGADLIASDKNGNQYAISVKSRQFGPTENETYVFDEKNQEKLCAFSKDFNLTPAVALVLIPRDFAFIDVYLMTLAGFHELAKRDKGLVESNAIKNVQKGLQINNYSLGTSGKQHSDWYGYLKYLHSNELIEHVRLDVHNRENFRKGLGVDEFPSAGKEIENEDKNLRRQLGDFGERLIIMLLGQLKKYKVALVDHVGADVIATDRKGKKYAISVKASSKGFYDFYEKYQSQQELSKLQNFADKYNMIPAIACVFIKKNFAGADIYIASLDNWLEVGSRGEAVKYHLDLAKHGYVLQENWWKNWKENLGSLTITVSSEKNKKKLDKEERIEHMEMNFTSLLVPDKEW